MRRKGRKNAANSLNSNAFVMGLYAPGLRVERNLMNSTKMVDQLIVEGLSNNEISKQLNISVNTIKSRRTKLRASSYNTRVCAQCGKLFPESPKGRHKHFCSDKCRFIYWNGKKSAVETTHKCENCGKIFASKGNPNKRYCSRKCYCETVRKNEG